MTTFYESELILRDTISSFRKGHSTSTVLMSMREDLLRPMKTGEVTLMVLADFSEAFNTVNHKILITKLSTLGFSKSFLLSAHFVQIDDRTSESVNLRFGVPQGSILCPKFAQSYLTYTFLFGKVISLPRLVYFLIRWRYCNIPQLSSSWATKMCTGTKLYTKHCDRLVF